MAITVEQTFEGLAEVLEFQIRGDMFDALSHAGQTAIDRAVPVTPIDTGALRYSLNSEIRLKPDGSMELWIGSPLNYATKQEARAGFLEDVGVPAGERAVISFLNARGYV